MNFLGKVFKEIPFPDLLLDVKEIGEGAKGDNVDRPRIAALDGNILPFDGKKIPVKIFFTFLIRIPF